ncbi:MAG: EAL domain-containing protein [Euzebyales bacterium]|nr:EAL domain-containing protein [Euzebyales bacterium]
MASGRVAGVEALLRWQHPDHGLINLCEFLPLAERVGLGGQLTERVLQAALGEARALVDSGSTLRMGVNVSVQSLHDHDFPATVAALLRRWSLPPSCLVMEVTERSLASEPRRAGRALSELAAMGVGLAVDDFGTGSSSLALLRQLPVTELKIGASFVARMASDSDDAAVVAATIDLGRCFGVDVVAEGVGSQRVWRMLARLGCDRAQGSSLCRPLPAAELVAWLAQPRASGFALAAPSPGRLSGPP